MSDKIYFSILIFLNLRILLIRNPFSSIKNGILGIIHFFFVKDHVIFEKRE